MHDVTLISTIVAGLTGAWLLGLITQRIGLSPIVGYLLAGVLVGPHTPGFAADVGLATQLAEIGVILLMFGVGLHFHVKDMLAVRGIAVPGALFQSAVATVLGIGVAVAFGWTVKSGIVLGMALAVASTVVLMRVLMDNHLMESSHGHAAVGWLVVEDILTVVILVILPALAAGTEGGFSITGLGLGIGLALSKIAALSALVLLAGGRVIPWLLVHVARLRSRELFTLTVLVIALAIASISAAFFGVSMALGAFLAGMVVGQTPVSQQAAADALPLRDAFSVLFFVSVGMLFDPMFILREPLLVVACLGVVLVAKPLAAFVIVNVLGYSMKTGLIVAAGLAQIGEFSFILAELGGRLGLLPPDGHSALVAVAIVSITLNPVAVRSLGPLEEFLKKQPMLWKFLNARSEARLRETNAECAAEIAGDTGPVAVVVGYGPVGRTVERLLREAHIETVVIEMNMDTVLALRAEGRRAIYGDAGLEPILIEAGIARASHLVITLPHSSNRRPMITAAKQLNPHVKVLVRARYLLEREDLAQLGAHAVCYEEEQASLELARLLLTSIGASHDSIRRETRQIRLDLGAEAAESPF